jgi:integrase
MYTEAWWKAYNAALAGTPPPTEGAGAAKTIKGSVSDLIVRFYQSAGFTTTAPATQRNYKSVLEPFRKEHGDLPVALVETIHVDAILGTLAARSTSAAKNLRKRLLLVFRLAMKWGFRTDNPVTLADRVKHNTKGYETWEEDDIDKFRAHWKIGTTQRLAFEILLNTGLRVSDAVRLGPQHLRDGFHTILTQKTKQQVSIPLHPDLRPVLDAITDKHLTYLATRQGKSRSSKAFTNYVIDAAKDAHLPPHRSAHGLRKAICVRLAEVGCDAFQIAAITGHQNLAEVQTYVAAANKKKQAQAGMDKLSKKAG